MDVCFNFLRHFGGPSALVSPHIQPLSATLLPSWRHGCARGYLGGLSCLRPPSSGVSVAEGSLLQRSSAGSLICRAAAVDIRTARPGVGGVLSSYHLITFPRCDSARAVAPSRSHLLLPSSDPLPPARGRSSISRQALHRLSPFPARLSESVALHLPGIERHPSASVSFLTPVAPSSRRLVRFSRCLLP